MKKLINNRLLTVIVMAVVYSFLWEIIIDLGYLIGCILGLSHMQILGLITTLGFIIGISLSILINHYRH